MLQVFKGAHALVSPGWDLSGWCSRKLALKILADIKETWDSTSLSPHFPATYGERWLEICSDKD
jgi:hypothetical protein